MKTFSDRWRQLEWDDIRLRINSKTAADVEQALAAAFAAARTAGLGWLVIRIAGSVTSRRRSWARASSPEMPGRRSCRIFGSRWSRCRKMWSFFGPTPLPSRISMVMARLTMSRGARSFTVGA